MITGSAGLVGSALIHELRARKCVIRTLDLRDPGEGRGDVRDPESVRGALAGCDGVVHLAAVSRVVWGERDPVACRSTNIDGVRTVLDAALAAPVRPWLVFASSREVYGQPVRLPADEETPLAPINTYGRTKAIGERMIDEARDLGLRAAIVRLSNVYGGVADHRDRVIPAFTRAAALGEPLHVEGPDHTFDFTHIRDTVRGIALLVDLLASGESPPPPIHLLTGRPTSLGEAAALAVELARSRSSVREAPPRDYDVARFHGSPARAWELLGWTPQVALRDGLAGMIADLRAEIGGAA
ncbi:MAG: NAD-dependent epimerase/dehydratase family protein [Myxococcales bacterium]|nr:NAD-dependent epimerase/dehydratase family protein [Myxococcales bacterium]